MRRICLNGSGTSGIGLATAKAFVSQGAYVFITGRNTKKLEQAKSQLGDRITTIQADVTSYDVNPRKNSFFHIYIILFLMIYWVRYLSPF